ncbi:MAG: hypothetical protein ABJG47_13965 [Ekhidna sp.]
MKRHLSTIQLIWLGVLFVWLPSCTFESDEEFFIEVDQSEIVTPSIDFINSPDTIYMRGQVIIDINISQGVDIVEYKVFIGSQEVDNGNSHTGRAFIDSRQFGDGHYPIVLQVATKTNTGSIGDQLGLEALITETKKVCLIDNAPITAQVTGFENVDGALTFSWDAYKSLKFEEYEVVFGFPYQSFNQTITSPEQTSVTIPDYIGGDISASFYLRAKGEEASASANFSDVHGVAIELNGEEPQLSILPNTYSSFDRYELVHNNSLEDPLTPAMYPIENRLYDSEQISIQYTYPINYNFDVYAVSQSDVRTYLGGANFNDEKYLLSFDEDLRYYFFEHTVLHLKVRETAEIDQAILYDIATGEQVAELSGEIALSPNGNQLFEYKDGIIIKYNPATLEGVDAFELAPLLSMEGEFRRLYVSNEGKLLFYNFLSHDPFGQRTYYRSYFLDANTKSFERTWNHSSTTFPTRRSSLLSPNGFLVDSDLFFISYFPYSQSDFPDIYSSVSTSQDDLSGVPRKVAPLHTSDSYLLAGGSNITKLDYVNHAVQQTLRLDGQILEIFSNFDDLCSVILEDNSEYFLVIISTDILEEVDRISLNPSILSGEKYMTNNQVFFEARNINVYDLEVNR